MGKLKIFLYG